MRVPIIMPQLGESIAEATVIRIGVSMGEEVTADQEIIEVETNKALMQVTTPCAGKVLELLANAQQTYAVGEVLGYVEAAPAEIERLGLKPDGAGETETILRDVPESHPSGNGHGPVREKNPWQAPGGDDASADFAIRAVPGEAMAGGAGGLPVPAKLGGAGYFSPRLRARLVELGLQSADLAGLPGTGLGGRVTIADLEKYVTELQTSATEPAPAIRLAVGEALRRSVQRPLATVGRPARLDALLAFRSSQPEPRPAFVLYMMRALALALATDRSPAGRIIGKRFLPAGSIDIGCAVEVEGGLMVPVLRAVDKLTVNELNGRFQDLVAAARRRQLPPDATGGAVATVSNFGIFNLTWATPIPLPDESLMLGLGAGRKVPHWDEEKNAFVPVTEAEVTLTFDHCVLDGGGAGRFLERVVGLLQEPAKL
jgi:pyruvate/2-oxoglutarate dehydrogenase complex dihydrolipoamide acyltransferase (E2) component